jgi:hypothetical protein
VSGVSSSIVRMALALAALGIFAPSIIHLVNALLPLVLLVAGLAVLLRLVWALTGRW